MGAPRRVRYHNRAATQPEEPAAGTTSLPASSGGMSEPLSLRPRANADAEAQARSAARGRWNPWRPALALAAALTLAPAAHAATVTARYIAPKVAVITVTGPLRLEDGEKFADAAQGADQATVALDSPGGSLLAGVRIGALTQAKGYSTLVRDSAVCASACAFAWLGGAKRLLGGGARLTFQAAGQGDGTSQEAPLLDAYLNGLGLPATAVAYLARGAPGEKGWLTVQDARAIGIPAEDPDPIPSETTAPAAAPPQAGAATPDTDRLRNFMFSYFAATSDQAEAAMAFLRSHYAATVNYYGKPTPRDRVLADKANYVRRWPERVYVPIRGKTLGGCDPHTGRCLVRGEVVFDCRSYDRGARSAGAAQFELLLLPDGDSFTIEGETSSVVARR